MLEGSKLFDVQDTGDGTVQARCNGKGGKSYEIHIKFETFGSKHDWADIKCSCPAAQKEPLCKHALGLLLWRLQPTAGKCWVGAWCAGSLCCNHHIRPPSPEGVDF